MLGQCQSATGPLNDGQIDQLTPEGDSTVSPGCSLIESLDYLPAVLDFLQ
jgi:hypothetical protein